VARHILVRARTATELKLGRDAIDGQVGHATLFADGPGGTGGVLDDGAENGADADPGAEVAPRSAGR